ncbi:MAG: hypothetical protein QOG59_2999, partial [Solirubrobacteraceae bacterium]|nr:hypothetical protein [Solirubrobacteraceae bacterium]
MGRLGVPSTGVTTIDPETLDPGSAWPRVAEMWCELLGAAPSGPHEDFFAAGGDSIQAAALLARIEARLGVSVALPAFMAQPTPATLGAEMQRGEPAAAGLGASASPEPRHAASCSYAQERFWFIDQASDSNVVSNVSWALRLRGPLDAVRLQRAVGAVVARHDSLRARFDARDGHPVMLVDDGTQVDLERLEAEGPEQAAQRAAHAAHTPF